MNRAGKKHIVVYIGICVLFLLFMAVACHSCGQELAISEYENNVNQIEVIDSSKRQAELNAIVEEGKMNVNYSAKAIFEAGANTDNMPTTELSKDEFAEDGIAVLDVLVKTKLLSSKREARSLVEQGGVAINDKKVEGVNARLTLSDFADGYVIIKKGKKVYHKVVVK